MPTTQNNDDLVQNHLNDISTEAGLGGIMGAVFEVIYDRENVSAKNLLRLTAADVVLLYEDVIAPAIDRLEVEL